MEINKFDVISQVLHLWYIFTDIGLMFVASVGNIVPMIFLYISDVRI